MNILIWRKPCSFIIYDKNCNSLIFRPIHEHYLLRDSLHLTLLISADDTVTVQQSQLIRIKIWKHLKAVMSVENMKILYPGIAFS